MDQESSLSRDELQSGLDFTRQLGHVFPIKVSFWFRFLMEDRFFLGLASDQFCRETLRETLHVATQMVEEHGSPFIHPLAIKLMVPEEPVAKRAQELRSDRDGIMESSSNNVLYRGGFVEQIYVYSAGLIQASVSP